MKIEVDISRKDYTDYNLNHLIKSKIIKRVGIFIGVLIVLQLALNARSLKEVMQILMPFSIFICIYAGILYFMIKRSGNKLNDNGAVLGKMLIEFNDEHMKFIKVGSESTSIWKKSMKLVSGKTALYLYLENNMAIIIPKRYFTSKDHELLMENYIKSHIENALQ